MVLEVAEEFEAIVVTICWIRCNFFVDGLAANVVFGTNSLLMSLSFKATRFSNGVLVRDNHNGSKTTWNPGVEVRPNVKRYIDKFDAKAPISSN